MHTRPCLPNIRNGSKLIVSLKGSKEFALLSSSRLSRKADFSFQSYFPWGVSIHPEDRINLKKTRNGSSYDMALVIFKKHMQRSTCASVLFSQTSHFSLIIYFCLLDYVCILVWACGTKTYFVITWHFCIPQSHYNIKKR